MIKRIFPFHFLWCACWEKQHLAHTNRLALRKLPAQHAPHSAADGLKKQRGRKCEHTVEGTCEIWGPAISIHNQLSEPVEVVGGGILGLGWAQQVSPKV